jgi:hypothetical protein
MMTISFISFDRSYRYILFEGIMDTNTSPPLRTKQTSLQILSRQEIFYPETKILGKSAKGRRILQG